MQETEKKDINLLDFQKVGKSGVPYEILDDKIAEYITQTQLNMFIMNMEKGSPDHPEALQRAAGHA